MWRALLLPLLSVLSLSAMAADKVIELATGEWPPYVSSTLQGNGVFGEMVRQVFKRAGYQVHYRFLSWPRCEEALRSGQALAAFPYRPTDERKQSFDFSPVLLNVDSYFFYYKPLMATPPVGFHALEDLRKYRIAVQLGYWYLPRFTQARLNMLETGDEETAVRLLQQGHLDLAPMSIERAAFQIHKLFPGREHEFAYITPALDKDTALALMYSRSYPGVDALRRDVDKAIQAMQADGSLKTLYQHYMASIMPQH